MLGNAKAAPGITKAWIIRLDGGLAVLGYFAFVTIEIDAISRPVNLADWPLELIAAASQLDIFC
jgi:hypothetical protein